MEINGLLQTFLIIKFSAGTIVQKNRYDFTLYDSCVDDQPLTFIILLERTIYAYMLGMNQLLWYYADLEKQECLKDEEQRRNGNETIMHAVSSRKGSKVQIIFPFLVQHSLTVML